MRVFAESRFDSKSGDDMRVALVLTALTYTRNEFMFEHQREPLIPFPVFLRRLLRSFCIAYVFVFLSLVLGASGYHYTESLSWLDATLNASMILTGMGPVNELHTTAGKVFATFYALYSGVAFLTIAAVLFAPVIHRFLHRFHLELDRGSSKKKD